MPPQPQRALILIDLQQGLDDPSYGLRSNPRAEEHVAQILQRWRQLGWPLFHIQHHSTQDDSPLRPDQPGVAFKPQAAPEPGEPVIVKHSNSAFVDTDLQARLERASITELIIVGLTIEHCVSSTARAAGDRHYKVWIVDDATAAHPKRSRDGAQFDAELVHEVALANLRGEFAQVISTERLLETLAKLEEVP